MSGPVPAREPCGCAPGATLAPHGRRTQRVLDHVDGTYAFREVERRRLRCQACGSSRSVSDIPLAAGFRMTRAGYDAVVSGCLAEGYVAVAARSGLDESTVRAAFADWSDRVLDPASLPVPAVAAVRARPGPAGPWPQVTDVLAGGLCAAFPRLDDPRFTAYLARFRASDLHTDVACHAVATASVGAGSDVTVHRLALLAGVDALLPRCLSRLRRLLPPSKRPALANNGALLLRPRFELSGSEERLASAMAASHPAVARFGAACQAIRRVWMSGDPVMARRALATWRDTLDAMMRVAFRPVLSFLARHADKAFGRGYGRVPPAAWERAATAVDDPAPGRTGVLKAACAALSRAAAPAPEPVSRPAPAPALVPSFAP